MDNSCVWVSTIGRTSTIPTATSNSCHNLTVADLVVAPQSRQNGSPLERGRVGGDISDIESLSSDDLC